MGSLRLALLLVALAFAPAAAELKVVGEGDTRTFDPSGFPPDIQEKYAVAAVRCANNSANCHAFGRTVDAIMTGMGPISKLPFDKEAAKLYGVKMMRKPESGMDKKETKAVVELLYYLLDQVRRRK
ncbi:MAG: cytochrome C [Deferrisomatales bacterium]